MCHRIKKIPTLSKLNHLLHSDKSTYFYKYNSKVRSLLYSPSIPLLGGAALLLVLGLSLSPSLSIGGEDKAYADDWFDIDTTPCAVVDNKTAKDLALTLGGDASSLSSEVTVNEVSYISQDFTVKACGYGNYTLTAQATPEHTGKLQGQTNTTEYIDGVGSEVLPANFATNKWGYAITDNTTAENSTLAYSTLPENGTDVAPAYSSTSETGGKKFKIAFAAKIGDDKPADHYGTQVLLSLAAGAGEVTKTWDTIEYMQDMTSDICKSATIGDTKQLIDTRTNNDGKTRTYWVAKLADENCWMTQNLDLDLEGVTLKPDSSDVVSDWVSTTSASTIWNDTSTNLIKYYDAGEYVYTTPDTANKCDNTVNGLSDCISKGWVNVSDMTASSDPNFGTEVTNNTYNAHYLAGNRYSWAAATAGQGATITGTETTDYPAETTQSICPKGWRLPINSSSSDSPYKDKSYRKLLMSYGANSGLNYGDQDIRTTPLYFLYGGRVSNGSLQATGSNGYYWSSTARSAANAYNLYFDSSSVNPSSDGSARYLGFSVRCVAR